MAPVTSTSALLRYAAAPDRPWRNGRGTARDLHDGGGWTLGVAVIAAAGEFSDYPGWDRTFVVADGEVDLTVDGTSARLGRGALATFPGEAAVRAAPRVPAHAVNVMTRRGERAATVHVERLHGPTPAATALVLLHGAVRVDGEDLAPFDALVPAAAGAGECRDALVVVVRMDPAAAGPGPDDPVLDDPAPGDPGSTTPAGPLGGPA